jgi:hypothetical protein
MKALLKAGPGREQGAATLLLVLGLVLLASLASAWSSRAVLVDLLGSQTRGQVQQARSAAQAALATAQADVLRSFAQSPAEDLFADRTRAIPCPADLQGPRWQCARLPMAAGSEMNHWQLGAIAARDLVTAPHVWQLRASSRADSGQGQAFVRESAFVPAIAPAPSQAPDAALLLNGCFSADSGSAWQICPLNTRAPACTGSTSAAAVHSHFVPDTNGNGTLSPAERRACLALTPAQLPGGGKLSSPTVAAHRSPCNRATWRSVLGDMTPAQIKAWSDAQASNGLHPLSQPARSIYWVDSPGDWTQSLGTPQAPVLLVFSSQACAVRCPRIAAGVQIHGTVLVDADCQDEKLQQWQAGTIDGLLAVEGGLSAAMGHGLVRARAYARQAFALHWPEGMDPRQVQRVHGSHREGPP